MRTKKLYRMLAIIPTIALIVSIISPFALAAETGATTANPDGTMTEQTISTATTTDPDTGNITVTVTIETGTTGTTSDGVSVNSGDVSVTTTVTDVNGNLLRKLESSCGSETREWIEKSAENGPEVTVTLIPGKTVSVQTEGPKETFLDGDVPENKHDTEYHYTETTAVTERRISATTHDLKIDPSASEYAGSGQPLVSIAPEDYAGKEYNDPATNQQTGLIRGFGPDSLLEDAENSGILRPEEAGYDYLYSGIGDVTNAVKVRSYMVTYARDAEGNLIPEVDEAGNPLFHEDGTPRYQLDYKLTGSNGDGLDKSTSQFALKNVETGQYFYAYCIDNDTETTPGAWYKVSNLEDCDYFPSKESENHIRAIVNNGYWGTESGTGSLDEIIRAMKAYYGDGEITASIDDSGHTATLKVSDIIDSLTEAEALAVTQAAIWTYANGSLAVQDGEEGRLVKDIVPVYQPRLDDARPSSRYYRKGTYGTDTVDQATQESNARIQAMYAWLLSLTEEAPADLTTVINEKNFLAEDSVKITVGDKIVDAAADPASEQDVYQVDLTFAMVVQPSTDNGDDLIVKLLDAKGNVIRQARLAGNADSDGEEFSELIQNDDNSYTFRDVPMAENSDLTFDLKLEGTQYLKKGVYVYTSPNTDETNTFQTLVGMAEGAQRVGVSAELTFSFAVDDTSQYHSETFWSWEKDLVSDPGLDPEPGPEPGPEADPEPESDPNPESDPEPGSEPASKTPGGSPFADVPRTNDSSTMTAWLFLALLSACGIAIALIFSKNSSSIE